MDTRDGRIYTPEEMKGLTEVMERDSIEAKRNYELLENVVEMKVEPTKRQMKRKPPRVKGYERCPCGSGRLFKNCCKH